MAHCPNCNAPVDITATACVACTADLGPAAGWHAVPDSAHERETLEKVLREARAAAQASAAAVRPVSAVPGVARLLTLIVVALLLACASAFLWLASGTSQVSPMFKGLAIVLVALAGWALFANGTENRIVSTLLGLVALAGSIGGTFFFLAMLGAKA